MEFLLIGDSKLKIVLGEKEIKEHKLESFVSERPDREGRRSFWSLLDIAGKRVGFDTEGEKILVQIYPQKGGCEIFVTKLGILSAPSARLVAKSDKITILSKSRSLYVFEDRTALVRAALAVKFLSQDRMPDADLYILGDRFFLSVLEYKKGGEPAEFPSILEFGRAITAELEPYIFEHADLVIKDDAIRLFSQLSAENDN